MKDFASYTGGNTPKVPEEFSEQLKQASKKFEGKSENDLLKAIYEQALAGKKNGTLTNEQIDEFCRQISPMLDAGKRKRLLKLAAELKKM